MIQESIPRYAPELSLPPYAFVPGLFPHPVSDPHGHSFGKPKPAPAAPDGNDWQACQPYLYGIDLFNHGYYWEAHEAWEGIWRRCERTGATASFLKGLIKLAAAGVKAREGVEAGVRSHARRAAELFREAAGRLDGAADKILGLSLSELVAWATNLAANPPIHEARPGDPAEAVFDFRLLPRRG